MPLQRGKRKCGPPTSPLSPGTLDTRRNLAPGCISSDVKLCQRKPFSFFSGPLFLGTFFLGVFFFS